MRIGQRITPCLWFDHQAEEAANFYVSVFDDARVTSVARYPSGGQEIHGRAPGSAMTVAFELGGQPFTALNGGPAFTFNEAVSLQVSCDNQEEVDHYWEKLSDGGDPKAQQCGWLKDKYGLSWQITPNDIDRLYEDENSPGAKRAMAAMLEMKKLDKAALERAFAGK